MAARRYGQGACETLGYLKSAEALPVFVRLLSHEDRWLRYKAAEAIKKLGPAAEPAVPQILDAVVNTAEPPQPISWADPIQFTHGQLADALFGGTMRSSVEGMDRKLLYSAIRVVSRNPDCMTRGRLAGTLNSLTEDDVKALLPDIVELAVSHGPADTMFSREIRVSAFKVLAKYHFQEGIRVAPLVAKGRYGCHNAVEIMKTLETYGSAAKEIIPDLKQLIIDYKELRKMWVFPDSSFLAVENAIKVIETATTHPELRAGQ